MLPAIYRIIKCAIAAPDTKTAIYITLNRRRRSKGVPYIIELILVLIKKLVGGITNRTKLNNAGLSFFKISGFGIGIIFGF